MKKYILSLLVLSSAGACATQTNALEGLGSGIGKHYKLIELGQKGYSDIVFEGKKLSKSGGDILTLVQHTCVRYSQSKAENMGASAWFLKLKYSGIAMLGTHGTKDFFWPTAYHSMPTLGPLGKIIIMLASAKGASVIYRAYSRHMKTVANKDCALIDASFAGD